MAYLAIFVFAGIYGAAFFLRNVPHWAGVAYLVSSVVCFAMYARDKAAARAAGRRASERSLLLLGLACGWPGAALAQHWLRHKSSKPSFQRKFWCTVVLNLAAFIFLSWTQKW